jgi:hypothetical protein
MKIMLEIFSGHVVRKGGEEMFQCVVHHGHPGATESSITVYKFSKKYLTAPTTPMTAIALVALGCGSLKSEPITEPLGNT